MYCLHSSSDGKLSLLIECQSDESEKTLQSIVFPLIQFDTELMRQDSGE